MVEIHNDGGQKGNKWLLSICVFRAEPNNCFQAVGELVVSAVCGCLVLPFRCVTGILERWVGGAVLVKLQLWTDSEMQPLAATLPFAGSLASV